MGLLRMSVFGVAGWAVLSTAGAMAADFPGDRPISLPAPAEPRRDLYSGWYLRGDLGYRWGRLSGSDPAAGFLEPTSQSIGNSIFGGIGAGYKSDWLRTDVTVDIGTKMKYEATTFSPNDTTANVSAITALFNGYLDLGTWYRATPYIGAGAGTSRLRISDYQSTAAPPFSGDTAHSQWNFAWAAMAGVAYRISPNMLVDVGYRYLSLGDIATASDTFGNMTLKNIAAHEVRVGLRWSFDDLPIAR